MVIAALLVIPLLILEQSATSGLWRGVAIGLNWVVWSAFLAEVVIMLSVVPDRWAWIRSHPLEVLIVALTAPVLPASMQALRVIRLLRLVRLLLVAKRLRGLLTPGGLSQTALVGLMVVLAGGAALREVEPQLELSIWDAMWWALVTATTVGYGDIVPITEAGRAIATVVMMAGIGFVALLTAALARMFVAEPEGPEAEMLGLLHELRDRLEIIEWSIDGSRRGQ